MRASSLFWLCPDKLTETPSRMTSVDAAAVYDARLERRGTAPCHRGLRLFQQHEPPGRGRRHRRDGRRILRCRSETGRAGLSASQCKRWKNWSKPPGQPNAASAPHETKTMTACVDRRHYRDGQPCHKFAQSECRSFLRCPKMRRPSTFSPPIRRSTRIGSACPRRSCEVLPEALILLASTLTDTGRAFGLKNEVDPIQHLVSAAAPVTASYSPASGRLPQG